MPDLRRIEAMVRWRTRRVRGAMRALPCDRHAVGRSIGDLLCPDQLDRAAAMLRQVEQVAARMCQLNAARRSPAASQVLGDQRCILVERVRLACVRSRRPARRCSCGAIGFELRLVGHRRGSADGRNAYSASRGEPRPGRSVRASISWRRRPVVDPSAGQQVRCQTATPMTAAALSVRFAVGVEAVDARGDGGLQGWPAH